jgi:hypothetical protein
MKICILNFIFALFPTFYKRPNGVLNLTSLKNPCDSLVDEKTDEMNRKV